MQTKLCEICNFVKFSVGEKPFDTGSAVINGRWLYDFSTQVAKLPGSLSFGFPLKGV